MKDLNLLPDDRELYVEWSTEWISKLIKIFRDNDNLNELLFFLESSKENIKTSTNFGNDIKRLLKEKGLNKISRDARIVMLSAHCPKRPDPQYPRKIVRDSYASFENMSETKNIHLLLEWDTGGFYRTIIKPGEIAEVTFNSNKAFVCHRSDGGDYTSCPAKNVVAQADDYFQLEENGEYSQ
ncbi:hypothetical protein EZ428_16195 [Pedobacter frigiditerrae]|uniref:Uncharacterized protein n=1 Tax=Pedobacter frigiditerrae TaxID=2530452 RepID=A0A4R0MRL9_9SPHI|nr:hypothetical protein [Pedobacter frigiditerrae]TCC89237.1 hypothetical protein EZ428_16195 [Pedobacter frigiditerrae]